ncbi:hypothetical protein [Pseudarthrobacter sp. PvP090]|uniref:hypothetical protein n=1 Tax=Pseudarthrobacter sp. PvP090 TaxID=3156393 RepID=UPI003395E762
MSHWVLPRAWEVRDRRIGGALRLPTRPRAAPTVAAALSVSAFNGGTAVGAWLGASALESTLGVLGPLTVAIIMAVLGLLTLLAMALMRATSDEKARPNA